ncbi:MAG TPA: MBL fold metallo-hydrolase, partial [Candidatus Corynebacterium faecipullorum]|nr:MBL fold metallo-hydrolase [Candidatus Corynebacterium faecipullorum]
PGDQWCAPKGLTVDVLLLPIAGPWVRGADAADYAMRIGARLTVPIHDAVLSNAGKKITDGMLRRTGVTGYQRLHVGESIDIH